MTEILQKVTKILFSSFDQTALIEGTSDIIIVKWDSGQLYSTPFLVCFGHKSTTSDKKNVRLYLNDTLLNKAKFSVDQYGYIHPMKPPQQLLAILPLHYGRNTIKFQLDNQTSISAQIHLYSEHDKILVSDMDGTLTKNDLGGLLSNFKDEHYLHDGYHELIDKAYRNGYKIVWLTMRSLPLYNFSKQYIRNHTKVQGVLLTEPEQFFPAIKKELMKQTGNIKTNMMMAIRNLFPKQNNPFVGGLGNRQNDAIAYRAAGIPFQNIFIVDTQSKVHHLSESKYCTSYQKMSSNVEKYFPKVENIKSVLTTYALTAQGFSKVGLKKVVSRKVFGNLSNTN